MRKITLLMSVFSVLSLLLAACGNATTPTQASEKPVNIEIETNPTPPTMGDAQLVFVITDPNGDPIDGATVDVSADHTDHTGMTMSGLATEQGDGRYALNANFSMSGNWKLTVYVRKEGLDYQEEIEFQVQ